MVEVAENEAQTLREELKRVLVDAQHLAKKYTLLEQDLAELETLCRAFTEMFVEL